MKHILSRLILSLFILQSFSLSAQNEGIVNDVFVYLKNGALDVFPKDVLKSTEQTADQLNLVLKDESLVTYKMSEIDHLGEAPTQFPAFTVFKFNNKYNENVYTDVYATIGADEITATVGAIGKSLTPSFQLNDPNGKVYVDGVLQQSKVSRHRFDKPIVYTLGYENYRQMKYQKVKDEELSPVFEEISLRNDMLSTNAPSNYPNSEGLDKLIDVTSDGRRDLSTFFHSTWGTGDYEKLPLDKAPYIEVHLDEAVSGFVFQYVTRSDNSGRNPHAFLIQGSNNGTDWVDIRRLTIADGMPESGAGAHYRSPNIDCKGTYSYLRFSMTKSAYKNYLALADFSLLKYNSSPDVYHCFWQPYGKDFEVKVDWLTDKATNVPRIDINLNNGQTIESIVKETYLDATIAIDGAGVFPNMAKQPVLIKGRGNSTWGEPKKPYRLKFASSVKPFGLKKGKNWVLLANAMNGSMLTNAIGMKIARMVGTAGANDIVPVELYVNNEYRGHYNFTQHVGLHNNSVDVDETNAVLLELDTYGDDKPRFNSDYFGVSTYIKAPDFMELPLGSVLNQEKVMADFNAFSADLHGRVENLERWYDPVFLARYFLVNEWIQNEELKHSKSCFLYREDLLAMHSRYVFGPVWDLDWAYGYEGTYTHCPSDFSTNYFEKIKNNTGGAFYYALRQREAVRRAYYQVWSEFMESHFDELFEYINDYYAYARPSLEHNQILWNQGQNYDAVAEKFKSWLDKRANYIYTNLEKFDLETPVPIAKGDANGDGVITIADVISIQNQLLGLPNGIFEEQQADANGDGKVTVTDMVWTIAWAMQAELTATRHMMLPTAEAKMSPKLSSVKLGEVSEMSIELDIVEGDYSATQFDVIVPAGITLEEVGLPENWNNCHVEKSALSEGKYRVAVYVANGETLPLGKSELQLSLRADQMIQRSDRVVSLDAASLVNVLGEDLRIHGKSALFELEVTGIENVPHAENVSGGKSLIVDALADGEIKIYRVDGCLFKVCPVKKGYNKIQLPSGVYIVNQQKILVNQ